MNTFILICIAYIFIFISVKLIKWIFFEAKPRIESAESKGTANQLILAFFVFSLAMALMRYFFRF